MSGWHRAQVSEPMRAFTAKPYFAISSSRSFWFETSALVSSPFGRNEPVSDCVDAGWNVLFGSAPPGPWSYHFSFHGSTPSGGFATSACGGGGSSGSVALWTAIDTTATTATAPAPVHTAR